MRIKVIEIEILFSSYSFIGLLEKYIELFKKFSGGISYLHLNISMIINGHKDNKS